MNSNDYEKEAKKAFDVLYHFISLRDKIMDKKFDDVDRTSYLSFIANSAILKLKVLKKGDYDRYLKALKENEVFNYLSDEGLLRKIKKVLLKTNPKLYLRWL